MMDRRMVLAGVGAMFATPVLAQSVAGDISGEYKAKGRNPDGSTYSGKVTIQQSASGAVGFSWVVGSQSYAGVGTRDGRVVSVDWGDKHPVVYVVMPDGSLHGTWADGMALERLER
mgnify:CR=1 FL=1